MSAIDAMESVRSPLSGDDESMDVSQPTSHRRHQSAGTLDITDANSKNSSVVETQSLRNISTNPPRIIDGVFDKSFNAANLAGPEREKRIVEIIEQQFNLEILLKHNQLVEIEEEIGKCEAQMIALRNKYKVEPFVHLPIEPKEFTEKYLRILQKAEGLYTRHKSVTWNNSFFESPGESNVGGPTSETLYSRTRSHTSSLRPSSGRYSAQDCIYRRTDGVYVKLTCPNCNRCNFSSAQGFLNHCRLAHQKEFTSQDNAAIICGEVLHDEDQDPDGLKVIQDLKSQGLDPNKNLAKPEVLFISQMLLNSGSNPAPPPLEPGIRLNQSLTENADQKKKIKLSISGTVGSKTPRTTAKLKLKLRSLGKGSEFDELVKDITAEVENPHLFEDEEEAENIDSSEVADPSTSPRPSVSTRGSSSTNRGRGRGRGRRKSRGGFSLLDDGELSSDSKLSSAYATSNKESNGNSAVDDDTTMGQ